MFADCSFWFSNSVKSKPELAKAIKKLGGNVITWKNVDPMMHPNNARNVAFQVFAISDDHLDTQTQRFLFYRWVVIKSSWIRACMEGDGIVDPTAHVLNGPPTAKPKYGVKAPSKTNIPTPEEKAILTPLAKPKAKARTSTKKAKPAKKAKKQRKSAYVPPREKWDKESTAEDDEEYEGETDRSEDNKASPLTDEDSDFVSADVGLEKDSRAGTPVVPSPKRRKLTKSGKKRKKIVEEESEDENVMNDEVDEIEDSPSKESIEVSDTSGSEEVVAPKSKKKQPKENIAPRKPVVQKKKAGDSKSKEKLVYELSGDLKAVSLVLSGDRNAIRHYMRNRWTKSKDEILQAIMVYKQKGDVERVSKLLGVINKTQQECENRHAFLNASK